eukprot:516071_1
MDSEGPYLVTLRVDRLDYDNTRDRYSISLNDCILSNEYDNKENITFEVNDSSKIIHIEKGKYQLDDEKTDELDEVDLMKKSIILEHDSMFSGKDKWFFILWGIYIIAAILVFMVIEGDTFTAAFYFRVVTSFGVGYGDFYPRTAGGKILNCVFIIIDLAKLAYIDWRIISLLFKYKQQKYKYDIMHSSTPHPRKLAELNENLFAKMVNNKHFIWYVLTLLGLFFISGTLVMGLHENYNWLDAIEWNFVTLSQVGYGNTIPKTVGGQIFTIFYIVFGYVLLVALAVIIFDIFMGKMIENYKERRKAGRIDTSNKIEMTGLLSQ